MNKNNFKKFSISFLTGVGFLTVIITGVLWNNLNEVKATPTPTPSGSVIVTGHAWSGNIGWIEFNNSKFGGVFHNTSTGQFSGYAWSENIGWIKFDGLSNDSGVGGVGAKADTSGTIANWARACAGTVSGICANMTSRDDGWYGWMRFDKSGSQSSNPATIDLTNGTARGELHGYAWGGDVVGWVSLSCKEGGANLDNICQKSNYQVKASLTSSSSSSSSSGGGGGSSSSIPPPSSSSSSKPNPKIIEI